MYPVSAAFVLALKQSHQIVTKVEVLASTGIVTLTVLSGNVGVAKELSGRRRCDLTLADPTGTLTPSGATSLLAPYGNEIKLYRGIRVLNTATGVYTEELVPLGVFGISDSSVEDGGGNLVISLSGFDRARKVSRAKFSDVYTVTAGTNYGLAIKAIIQSRMPASLLYNFATTASVTPALLFDAGEDPWEKATEMAESIGHVLYFDPDGVAVLAVEPNTLTLPTVATFAEGSEATILSVNKRLDDEKTYNHIIISGETSSTNVPVRAEAKDTLVTSPTYYLGPYGDVVYFYSSQYITTAGQAQEAADAILRRSIGYVEQVRINAIPNPALEVDDVIQITRTDSQVANVYAVDSFNIPLEAAGVMSLNTRSRKAV